MKAIVVPADITKPIAEVEGETYATIVKIHTNIHWVERINTRWMHDHGFMMGIDSDGFDRQLEQNFRATAISRYPAVLVGDAILFTEKQSFGDGLIFGTVADHVMGLLEDWDIQGRAEHFMREHGLIR